MKLDIAGVAVPLLPCPHSHYLCAFMITVQLGCFIEGITPLGVDGTETSHAKHGLGHLLSTRAERSPLKYFTVFTLSSSMASSSHTNTVLGCCWKADTVHMWLTPSSMALYKAKALWAPVIRIITCTPSTAGQSGPGARSDSTAPMLNYGSHPGPYGDIRHLPGELHCIILLFALVSFYLSTKS